MATCFQSELVDASVTNLIVSYDGSTIDLPNVTLDGATGQRFAATISEAGAEVLRVDVTGTRKSARPSVTQSTTS